MLCFHMTTSYDMTDRLDNVMPRPSNEDDLVGRNKTPRFGCMCDTPHARCRLPPDKPTIRVKFTM